MDEQTDQNQIYRFVKVEGAYVEPDADGKEQRMVYGIASTEDLDSQGDVVDIDAIKAALPDYLQFANVREMHQPKAVGRVVKAWVEDNKLHIQAKIVDDDTWEKVKQKVLQGFSIGGKAIRAAKEAIQDGGKQVRRITELLLNEISLVDRPANPNARILLFKRDDTEPASPWALDDEQVSVIGKATHERLNERTKPTRDEEVMPVTETDAPGRVLASLQELRNAAERDGAMYRVMCLNLAIKHFLRGTDMSDDDEEMEEYPMEPMERMDAALDDMQAVLSGDIAKGMDYSKMRGYMKKMRTMMDEMEKMFGGDEDKDEKAIQSGDIAKAEPAFTLDDVRAALADVVNPLAERLGKLEQQPTGGGPVLNTAGVEKVLPGQQRGESVLDTQIAELRKRIDSGEAAPYERENLVELELKQTLFG